MYTILGHLEDSVFLLKNGADLNCFHPVEEMSLLYYACKNSLQAELCVGPDRVWSGRTCDIQWRKLSPWST